LEDAGGSGVDDRGEGVHREPDVGDEAAEEDGEAGGGVQDPGGARGSLDALPASPSLFFRIDLMAGGVAKDCERARRCCWRRAGLEARAWSALSGRVLRGGLFGDARAGGVFGSAFFAGTNVILGNDGMGSISGSLSSSALSLSPSLDSSPSL